MLRTKSKDPAAHAVRAPLSRTALHLKESANIQQVLVLQENALVSVLLPRTRPQVALSAPVVLAQLVSYLPSFAMTLCL